MTATPEPAIQPRDVWRLDGQPTALAVVIGVGEDRITAAAALPGDWSERIPNVDTLPAPEVDAVEVANFDDPILVTVWPSLVFDLPTDRIGRLLARDGPEVIPRRAPGGLLQVMGSHPRVQELTLRFVADSIDPIVTPGADSDGAVDAPSESPTLAAGDLRRIDPNAARQRLGLSPEAFGEFAGIPAALLLPTLRGQRAADLQELRRVEQALIEQGVDPSEVLSVADQEPDPLDTPEIQALILEFAQRRGVTPDAAGQQVRDQLATMAARDRGDSLQQRIRWIIEDTAPQDHDDGR